ncbi:hypothetical protein C0995_000490 [Termitomyces sp. Mi166|nr:hypothetical protein C0995_000490 [Termitomyces sp. Mi166\
MTQNGSPFHWRPLHQRCFEMIKQICAKTPIIRPIDPKVDEPIWLICDVSKTGVGAMFGQGIYDFDITYVKGELNKVADCLSQYFESDTTDDVHNVYDYVQADKWIDPEGKDLPLHRFHEIMKERVEIQAMQAQELCRSKRLKEQLELRNLEAQQMVEATKIPNKGI